MAVIVTLFESDSCTRCGANCPGNSREDDSAPPLPVCEKTATTLVQTAAQILDTATSGITWKSSNPGTHQGQFGQLASSFIGAFALQHQDGFVFVGGEIEFTQHAGLVKFPSLSSFRFQSVVCELAVVDAGNLFFESQYLHASRP
jgi:hypothetical protein